MITKEAAIEKIRQLVERFEEQKDFYSCPEYNETLTRRDFIDPFFQALGWDVANEQGYAETYREVIHEDRLRDRRKINGRAKFPDYSFRLSGGKRLFFVEAKKPSVFIKNEITPAFQIRTYGWSAGLPISIITDFEEFAVYDCTRKPRSKDKPSTGRIKYLTFRDYVSEFDFIWNTFSKERVLKGSFDRFVENDSRKGTTTVDIDFLNLLGRWRKLLATDIGHNHPGLDEENITFAVQEIINRIIFLRIAEDRDVERYGHLRETIQRGDHYRNLIHIFRQANEKYNAEFFSLGENDLTHSLRIDNRTMRSIIGNLYPPDCSYAFDVIPIEIMGTAYEQFLGKLIKITPSHRVKIEEKPEVRKAGGVYYTPQYIVDYIVENTVQKLVKGKTPKEISRIRILDPACGSGSFLIGAYQYLLDYHRDYYIANSKIPRTNKNSPLTPDGYLTSAEKKRILVNNIYGVDIDRNAVQVTKMALLLKCMEGETVASIETQLRLFHEPILPALQHNIKAGNSLIDTDYYEEGDNARIKTFNWQEQFPAVFAQGGFDAVIGNPPYVLLQNLESREAFNYARKKYRSARYKIDSYQIFIEASVNLLNREGLLGFITPNTFLKNVHAEPLRRFLLETSAIRELVLFNYPVFSASVDTCVIITEKNDPGGSPVIKVKQVNTPFRPFVKSEVKQASFGLNAKADFNVSVNEQDEAVIKRLEKDAIPLGNFFDAYFGIQTFDRKKYVAERKLGRNYVPVIDGGNIHSYWLKEHTEYVQFAPEAIKSGGKEAIYTQERIGIRQIGETPVATLVPAGIYTLNTIYNVYPRKENEYNIRFILAVINSNPGKFYWRKMNSDEKRTFPKIKKDALLSIPLPVIGTPGRKQLHDDIVKCVNKLMKLYDDQYTEELMSNLVCREDEITHYRKKISTLLYQLYGLNEEELAFIEDTMKPVYKREAE